MTQPTESICARPFDVVSFWGDWIARMQRIGDVYGNAFQCLVQEQARESAEAAQENLSRWTAAIGTPSPLEALAGWPMLILPAQWRAVRLLRRSLEVWSSSQRAITQIVAIGVDDVVAPGGGPAAGTLKERRVSAQVIDFPDRRAAARAGGARAIDRAQDDRQAASGLGVSALAPDAPAALRVGRA